MKIEQWPIEKLIDYARNPRKNDQGVDKLAAAIKEFGFRVPIVAKSDGLIVDGHMRLKAAKKLQLKEVPVLLADDMTDAQVKAFRLSVNKMAELAEWDMDLLKLEFKELEELNFDLGTIGFDDKELDVFFEIDEECDLPNDLGPSEKPLKQMTFILHIDQHEKIEEIISEVKKNNNIVFYGNENSNGNALFYLVNEWEKQNL